MPRIDPRLVLAAILAAVGVASTLTEPSEGLRLRPYYDPAMIRSYCFGETENVEERLYSKEECASRLRARMARDYAPAILGCVPAFADPKRRNAFAASIDASYNAGSLAFCRSPMAKAFNAGRWTEGCAAFKGWYVSARNRRTGVRTVLPGLVKRRNAEAALCAA
jgi:lysozyme